MHQNQVLLKAGDASKVVSETPDTRLVLMDGTVNSHRVILASNPFLHKLISSSWVAGEISTFIMPQHSVRDLLLHFPLPGIALANGAFDEEPEVVIYDFGEIKVEEHNDEEDYISDHQNGDRPTIEQFKQPIEPGEIFREDYILPGLNQIETPRKRLRPESPSSLSPPDKSRRMPYDEQSDRSKSSAKDIPEDDNLIVELFGDNATLAETVTADDPDSWESEVGIVNGQTELETRSKTLVNFSLHNVGAKEKKKRQAQRHSWKKVGT